MKDVLTGNFAARRWDLRPASVMRVVNWNIDRGLRLRGIVDFLDSQNADLLILQEVDLNARRTRRLNIAEEIARRLEMNYVFGWEFQELTQGSRTSPAYHGQATLSRWPLENPRVIRFRHQSSFWRPRWFLPRTEPFQERIGGRLALVTEIDVGGKELSVYNLHLESRGNKNLRLSQLEEVLEDAANYPRQSRALLAGDLNFDASDAFRPDMTHGLDFRSAIELPSPHTTPARWLFQRPHTIDWAFVSGPIRVAHGQVHNMVNASDHYPISLTIEFS
ncbi:MAG TPA: endonuclease/exonuclease/phosphatase family protein [Bryobacteraceae bacterium]|nr:endonuclease/exonuclease/phosphatase family protein [Bryobacteraceae bacterium]